MDRRLGNVWLISYFLEITCRNLYNFFLKRLSGSPVKQSWPGAFWFERLFKSDTISLSHIGLFKLSISSCVKFWQIVSLEIGLFHLDY